MKPYERLLGDALRGDPMLFVGEDGVEAARSVVDPILGNATPAHEYEPNSWGPTEADHIIAGYGGWHNPKPTAEQWKLPNEAASEDEMMIEKED
jgi:glucose-6-phosphate 1-dehydrogenase